MNDLVSYIGSRFSLPDQNYIDILIRLTYAVVIGGLIGLERSGRNRDAGLRTHILVCLGAASIMVLSETVHLQYGGDIGRFGAQVVSGIGFLGAGCIMVKGSHVSGLTTAAGLWTTACIGLTIGMGYFFISTVIAVLLLISMFILRPLSFRLKNKGAISHCTLKIKLADSKSFSKISSHFLSSELHIDSIKTEADNIYILEITGSEEYSTNQLLCTLMEHGEILEINQL